MIFIPSSHALLDMIRRAEAKFDASRKAALTDRAEQAFAHNRRVIRESRAHDCRRHVYVGQSTVR